jgi:hypothetical protein
MPVTYFPQIGNALTTQLPYRTGMEFSTAKSDMPTGERFSYYRRAAPLSRFDLNFESITDAELASLEAFFAGREGRLQEFIYLDPAGNLIGYSEDYTNAAWEKYAVTVGSAQADPFGGNLATAATASGSNGMLAASVLPDGDASGFVLCGSVWVKPQSPGQTLMIGFIDAGFSVLDFTVYNLPVVGEWRRIFHTITLGSNAVIRMLIGGLGTWNATALHLFGAQCVPMRGPGAYAKTPGNGGLHRKCRFDTDDFTVRYAGPNDNAVKLPIKEYSSGAE